MYGRLRGPESQLSGPLNYKALTDAAISLGTRIPHKVDEDQQKGKKPPVKTATLDSIGQTGQEAPGC